jgi:hypothetical protein
VSNTKWIDILNIFLDFYKCNILYTLP